QPVDPEAAGVPLPVKTKGLLTPDHDFVLTLGSVKLEIPAGAVTEEVEISIEKLSEVEDLNTGMNNVTGVTSGYRFLPSMEFLKDIQISLPYAKDQITNGFELANLSTYYFNEQSFMWERVEKISMDEKAGLITSKTNHFTDFINSTLKLPESPKPLSFNPNSIKDMKAANPLSGIPQLKGLEANNQGSGNFSLAFTLPAGRNGMTPQLGLSYNSDISNGWLGVGFDINIPCITIDTKFGLPKYDGNDTYVLNGQELIAAGSGRYRTRVEGAFEKITKSGNTFTVISKNGTQTLYGTGSSNLNNFKFYISQVIDPNGNTINYDYTHDSGYLYLTRIRYTGHVSDSSDLGKYVVDFINEDREDRSIDCRGGFESKLGLRLKEIQIRYVNTVIRKYVLTYKEGGNDFKKSCIERFSEIAYDEYGTEEEFYSYGFDYYGMPEGNEFGDTEKWAISGGTKYQTKALTTSHSIGGGGGLYFGVGVNITDTLSVGGGLNLGFQIDTGFDETMFIDINGDSLPDMVGKTNGRLEALVNNGNGGFDYVSYSDAAFSALFNQSLTPSFSIGGSLDMGVAEVVSINGNVGGSFNWANALNKFTDLNGDGIIDFIPSVSASSFKRGTWRKGQGFFDFKNTSYASHSSSVVSIDSGMDSAGVSGQSDEGDNVDVEISDLTAAYHLLDPVVKWKAYHGGNLRVTGAIEKTDDPLFADSSDLADQDGVVFNIYHKSDSLYEKILTDTGTIESFDLSVENVEKDSALYFKVNGKDNIVNDTVHLDPVIQYESIDYFDDLSDYDAAYITSSYSPDVFNKIVSKITEPDYVDFLRDRAFEKITETVDIDGIPTQVVKSYDLNTLSRKDLETLTRIFVSYGIVIPKKLSKTTFENILASNPRMSDVELNVDEVTDEYFPEIKDIDHYHFIKAYRLDSINKYYQLDAGYLAEIGAEYFFDLLLESNDVYSEEDLLLFSKGIKNYAVYQDTAGYYIQTSKAGYSHGYHILKVSDADQIGQISERGVLFETTQDEDGIILERKWLKDKGLSEAVLTVEKSGVLTEELISVERNDYRVTLLNENSDYIKRNTINESGLPLFFSSDEMADLLIAIDDLDVSVSNAGKALIRSHYQQVLGDLSDSNYYLVETLTSSNLSELQSLLSELQIIGSSLPESIYYETYVSLRESEIPLSFTETFFVDTLLSGVIDPGLESVLLASYAQDADNTSDTDYYLDSFIDFSAKESLVMLFSELNVISYCYDKSGEYYVLRPGSESPALEASLESMGLIHYTGIINELIFYETGSYAAEEEAYSSQNEDEVSYSSLEVNKHGLTSYILLPELNDELSIVLVKEYIHVFKLSNDFHSSDLTMVEYSGVIGGPGMSESEAEARGEEEQGKMSDHLAEIESQKSLIKEYFSGGVYNWYYGEWNGNKSWSENALGLEDEYAKNFMRMSYTSETGHVKGLDTLDQQDGSSNGRVNPWGKDMWHGTDSSYQDGGFDENGNQLKVSKNYISYVGKDSSGQIVFCPSQVGGDTINQLPALQSESIGLDKVNFLSNSFTAGINTGGGVTLKGKVVSGGLSVTYNKGFSISYKDLMDINGDRYPDQLHMPLGSSSLDVIYNKDGGGFASHDSVGGLFKNLRQLDNSTLSFGTSCGASAVTSETIPSADAESVKMKVNKGPSWGGSISFGGGYSRKVIDFMDINGDGLADHVMRNDSATIALNTTTGSDYSVRLNTGNGFTPHTWSVSDAQASKGIYSDLTHSNTMSGSLSFNVGNSTPMKSSGTVGFNSSLAVSVSGTSVSEDMIDINGDGLLDNVEKDGNTDYFVVRYNMGDHFSDPVNWKTPGNWNSGDGFMLENYMFSFLDSLLNTLTDGRHVAAANENNLLSCSNQLRTRMSENAMGTNYNLMGATDTISYSSSFGFTIGATIPVMIKFMSFMNIVSLCLYINPNMSFAYSQSSAQLSMTDINGDGLPDRVFKYGLENVFRVQLNKCGKVGLLKTITTPSHGKILLDFAITQNTVDMPNAKYVLTKVVRDDGGIEGNIIDENTIAGKVYTTTFEYGKGFYHRKERTFYGFDSVITRNADDPNQTYTEVLYDLDHYYSKNLAKSTTLFAGTKILQEQINEYDYRYVDQAGIQASLDPSAFYNAETETFDHEKLSVFPMLTKTTTVNYDLNSSESITTVMEISGYDDYGNVTTVYDYGSDTTTEDDIYIELAYHEDTGNYIVGSPDSMVVRAGYQHGPVLRQRSASFDTKGNMTELVQYNTTGNSVYTLSYEPVYGNLVSMTDPNGYSISYGYETELNTHINRITDSFGLTSTVDSYNYLLGVETKTTDTNGSCFEYDYDHFGRMKSVWTDYDTGVIAAVSFEYYPDEFPSRAVTHNKTYYAADNDEVIKTVIIVDGLGRSIQTKKTGTVLEKGNTTPTEGMNISGVVLFDLMGRAKQQGQPLFQPGEDLDYWSEAGVIHPTINTYDALGRVTETLLPDESLIQTDYAIDTGLFKTTVTDPKGNQKISYADVRENIIQVDQFNQGRTITTSYEYDLLGQITQVIDTQGNTTSITYDLLGRRTSIDNPDMGLVEYFYDAVGNLTRKVDNNLRSKGQVIEYIYDRNRLEKIDYPEKPDDQDVTYTYGTSAAANNAGRIIRLQDESGITEFEYGILGEQEKITKTLNRLIPGKDALTFESSYTYDYLGRMNTITYPDGEVLTYTYNRGGQIESVRGEHRGFIFDYVKQISYDQFGQRVYIQYGNTNQVGNNDVETWYTYDEKARWLTHLKTTNSSGDVFQDLTYEFDKVGNISRITNIGSGREVVQAFTYDDLYQLTGAQGTYTQTGALTKVNTYTQSYQYDDIGNMT
ncbi:MAG: hypothetical protein MJB14_08545, partial [Spirochaetes bacterium]|nr:hypothetical protein [Spirochaetota bacterium]